MMKLFYFCFFILSMFYGNSFADFDNNYVKEVKEKKDFESRPAIIKDTKEETPTLSPSLPSDLNSKDTTKPTKPKETPKSEQREFLSHNTSAPIQFKGKTAEGSRTKGEMVLSGNVVIVQDTLTFQSERAELFSSPGVLPSASSILKVVAKKNVKIHRKESTQSPELRAVANEMTYRVPEKVLVLKGKAKIWKENETLQGEFIELNLLSGEVKILDARGVVDPEVLEKRK